jgi:LAS superfamily LD-carboxypeptidase LdcB
MMAELPIKKLVMPTDLTGVTNGKLPRKLLTKINPSGKLYWRAAQSWEQLRQLASNEGLVLVHVGDYRPYNQQLSLFKSRMKPYPNAKVAKQTTRQFNGKTWYLHTGAPVATPGTSNHGWGLAIDAALKVNGKVVTITTKPKDCKRSGLRFLLKVAPDLGWSWELQSEPWHIRYVLGDKELPATA